MSSKIKNAEAPKADFALSKENYILIIIGCAIILLGFLLMMGGKSEIEINLMPTKYLVSEELHWHQLLY